MADSKSDFEILADAIMNQRLQKRPKFHQLEEIIKALIIIYSEYIEQKLDVTEISETIDKLTIWLSKNRKEISNDQNL